MATTTAPRVQETNHRNHVRLIGHVSSAAVARTLRDGAAVVTWRMVVDRSLLRPGGAHSDTVDCIAWEASVRRSAPRWRIGDLIDCEGALHRRFWRSAGGTLSRIEVEVNRAHRVGRARGARRAAGPAPPQASS